VTDVGLRSICVVVGWAFWLDSIRQYYYYY